MKRHELIKDHIKRIGSRYRGASKALKKVILDEFCRTWGVGRKYAIRLLGCETPLKKSNSGRPPLYDERLVKHVTVLWDSMERICAKRMKAAIPIWLPFYRSPEFDLRLRQQILEMSPSTIDRFIKRGLKSIRGMSLTRKTKFFKYKIPLHVFNENIINTGHVAADTVGHCGDRADGQYAHSLTVTDRLTTWTENRALFTKKSHEMNKAMQLIEDALPFRILSIQNDCGTEFLNYNFMKYLHSRPRPVVMTRSRPYHKNDNAHVEQKNFTHVREVFGYERVENPELIELMNEIYRDYWNPLNNFFLPSMKLREKERNGSKITKRYDDAQTPYQRLMKAPNLSEERKEKLKQRYKGLNPFELKAGLEQRLKSFFLLLKNKVEKKAA
jgi:hypothetical protein